MIKNSVSASMLGLCPVLAVSLRLIDALWMALATGFVLIVSNLMIGAVHRLLTKNSRFFIFIIIVATLTTSVDYLLQAYQPAISQSLGIFIPLVTVNCIILTSINQNGGILKPFLKFSIFSLALLSIASVRELFGQGTLFNYPVMPTGFRASPVLVFALPPAGFILLGLYNVLLTRILKRWS